MDLRHATCLRRVLALYPHEPRPLLECHAPILPIYPSTCEGVEDVMLGCHQGALGPISEQRLDCKLAFCRIQQFLQESDVPLPDYYPTAILKHVLGRNGQRAPSRRAHRDM